MAVTTEPPQFVRFVTGHERLCANTAAAVKRTEREIYETCEAIVERRVAKLQRLVRAVHDEA